MTQDLSCEELGSAKRRIEDLTGKKVQGYRAPYFSITDKSFWALEILKKMDFSYDCSISSVKTWRYGVSASPDHVFRIKELDLVEFPVSTANFLGSENRCWRSIFQNFPFLYFPEFFSPQMQAEESGNVLWPSLGI